jgi:hypothetical protein
MRDLEVVCQVPAGEKLYDNEESEPFKYRSSPYKKRKEATVCKPCAFGQCLVGLFTIIMSIDTDRAVLVSREF